MTGKEKAEKAIAELEKVLRDLRQEADWDPRAESTWSCKGHVRRLADTLSIYVSELRFLAGDLHAAGKQEDKEREAAS